MSNKKDRAICSFCGTSRDRKELTAGLDAHICAECIERAHDILVEEVRNEAQGRAGLQIQKPVTIKEHLDEYVIGQGKAKKVLSVAVYNHYKRLIQNSLDDVEIEKANILMVGETGTGKTLLARSLARTLRVPFCIADATVITEAGYVGEDVETILTRLLQAADYDREAAERGIVYIDEIDKVSRKSDNPSITRDVSGEGVQQALLKLLEGAIVHVPPQGGRKHPEQKMVAIDTRNILFICGGAFNGIEKMVASRLNTHALGFAGNEQKTNSVESHEVLQHVGAADLRSFGIIPELIGRMPVITSLNPLDEKALRQVLTEPKNAIIKQYMKLFEMENIDLSFTDGALDYIVGEAVTQGLGARGLKSICEAVMLESMYELPSSKDVKTLVVDKNFVKKHLRKNHSDKLRVA